ncbi:STE3-domain-containing protein [Ceraceosorus guamensis]|uniref:STE3-domain-containing protein n=1 Tax=Ceraceosorus guamensis TaxID=1522189 RepID=A0A316W7A7_9BASI|nr:STE3-domain-containing protein [Ceraceosorus guamensis]PWN45810.1 STE3-domain-containing protein [Ceraceosorus guamensis]
MALADTQCRIFWVALGNCTMAISAILYANTFDGVPLGWCDFAGAVGYLYGPGISAGALCLFRKLESIASTRQVAYTQSDRRRFMIVDLIICVGIPVLLVPLHIVVQDHRMDVVLGHGCNAPTYMSVPALFCYYLWQIGLATACVVYAVLTLRWFLIRRSQLSSVLQSSGTGISKDKYIRLMLLAFIEVVISFPLAVYVLAANLLYVELQPYPSWDYVHDNWGAVGYVTTEEIPYANVVSLEIGRWLGVLAAGIFFAFFGLTADTRRQYASWIRAISGGRLCKRRNSDAPLPGRIASLPRRGMYGDTSSEQDLEKDWTPTNDSVEGEPRLKLYDDLESPHSASFTGLKDIHVTTERIQVG